MTDKRYGAERADWDHFLRELGPSELLPVVSNPHAEIAPNSKLKALGKVPSRYYGTKAGGIANWTNHQATAEEVAAWSRVPDYGICVQTRTLPALDCDIEDEELAARIREMIDEYLLGLPTRTRGTWKFLCAFRMDSPGSKRVIKTSKGNIEFLAEGQQFVAAGTHTSGERYRWLPESPRFPTVSRDDFERLWKALHEAFGIGDSVVAESVRAPRQVVRNDAVEADPVAAWLVSEGKAHRIDSSGRLDITCPWEAEHTGGEAGDTSTSYWPAHTGGYAGGAFKCLHAHCAARGKAEFLEAVGYRPDNLDDFDPVAGGGGPGPDSGGDFDLVVAPAGEPPAPPKPERFPLTDWSAFADRPAPEFIIDDILPQAALAVLFGAPGSGKSFSIIDMCMAIARGTKWRDKDVKQGGVLYVAAEGAGGVAMRLRAYREYHEPDAGKMEFMVMSDAPDMMKVDDVKLLIKRAITIPNMSMIVLDTLAQVTPGANENASEDMGKLINHCKALHKHTGALVILVHHSGKNAAQGARGHSSLLGAADAMLEGVADGDNRCLTVTKMKDGEMLMEFPFRLNVVDLGQNAKGKRITSCVVLHNNESPKLAKGPKSEHAAAAFRVFNAIINNEEHQGRIDHERWLLACMPHFIDTREDPSKGQDPRRQNIARGIKKLVEQHYVLVENGWYSAPCRLAEDGFPVDSKDFV